MQTAFEFLFFKSQKYCEKLSIWYVWANQTKKIKHEAMQENDAIKLNSYGRCFFFPPLSKHTIIICNHLHLRQCICTIRENCHCWSSSVIRGLGQWQWCVCPGWASLLRLVQTWFTGHTVRMTSLPTSANRRDLSRSYGTLGQVLMRWDFFHYLINSYHKRAWGVNERPSWSTWLIYWMLLQETTINELDFKQT